MDTFQVKKPKSNEPHLQELEQYQGGQGQKGKKANHISNRGHKNSGCHGRVNPPAIQKDR